MTDQFDRCPKCGALVRRGAACHRCAQQPAASSTDVAPSRRRAPSATLTVALLAIIPFLVMVAVLFHVAMYAVSAPATIALDVIIVAAIVYDIRQVLRSRAR